jgi:hypothetical protein
VVERSSVEVGGSGAELGLLTTATGVETGTTATVVETGGTTATDDETGTTAAIDDEAGTTATGVETGGTTATGVETGGAVDATDDAAAELTP